MKNCTDVVLSVKYENIQHDYVTDMSYDETLTFIESGKFKRLSPEKSLPPVKRIVFIPDQENSGHTIIHGLNDEHVEYLKRNGIYIDDELLISNENRKHAKVILSERWPELLFCDDFCIRISVNINNPKLISLAGCTSECDLKDIALVTTLSSGRRLYWEFRENVRKIYMEILQTFPHVKCVVENLISKEWEDDSDSEEEECSDCEEETTDEDFYVEECHIIRIDPTDSYNYARVINLTQKVLDKITQDEDFNIELCSEDGTELQLIKPILINISDINKFKEYLARFFCDVYVRDGVNMQFRL